MFFPQLCAACGEAVPPLGHPLCLRCELELPLALVPRGPQPVEKAFWGRLPLTTAHAWLRFRRDNRARQLLHNLKYGGDPRLVREMGRLFARAMLKTEHGPLPEVLIPVPLHPKKLRTRGYNQAEMIALGLGDVLGRPVLPGALERIEHRASLTKLSRVERWEQIKSNYRCRSGDLSGIVHAGLVDDVITTGATLEVCGGLLLEHGTQKLSLAALAYAEQMF